MKFGSWISPLRGITAVMAAIMALSVTGYALADSWRSSVDDMLGTSSYGIDDSGVAETEFQKDGDCSTIDGMMTAAKNVAIKEGEEGTVVLKNDNSALPLSSANQVALFGLASYAPYCASDDLNAGNADAIDLEGALEDAGFTVNSTLASVYAKAMNKQIVEVTNAYTGEVSEQASYDISPQTTVGDMTTFNNNEISVDNVIKMANVSGVSSTSDLNIQSGTVGIVTIARAGGESNTYLPAGYTNGGNTKASAAQISVTNGSIDKDKDGNTVYTDTDKDALQLSDVELGVIATANTLCSKVVVLLNTSNDMMISDLVAGEDADAIAYIGVPNDYQFEGIVNVLDGKANSTGALTDTYVVDNWSNPAMQNFGGDFYDDYKIVETGSTANGGSATDSRWGSAYVTNGVPTSSFSASDGTKGSVGSYSGGQYIVEAEGIYVGYKYYETRYYDSIMDSTYIASTAGSTYYEDSTLQNWDYNHEVVYPFGYGMSYDEYTQAIDTEYEPTEESTEYTDGIKVDL
ncbi:MAG: glycoside hydrolase family 3 C-terminal domain-containing protein [Clostridia bacterium]|nr:glycoside hydrolase family 3 C-terminal domain-containing protein [Clostridia bacterium]